MNKVVSGLLGLFVGASVLAGCGADIPAAPDVAAPSAAVTQANIARTAPRATSAPTTAPRATASAATRVPAPTAAPQPTNAPTAAPAATNNPSVAPQPTAAPSAKNTGEILFLRGGVLTARNVATGSERTLADGVRDFAVAPNGTSIAMIREVQRSEAERGTDLWTVQRDGGGLAQITKDGNALIEATPSWAPDGSALVFAAADSSDPYTRAWPDWAQWCKASTVHLWQVAQRTDATLAQGCDPSFGPDGKRVAYAAPPTTVEPGTTNGPTIGNSIRLINRQGQNGWNFAQAAGPEAAAPRTGRLVYAPAWSPDGAQVVYHRFVGYQTLVDVDITEIAPAFKGNGTPIATGAGWLLPARFSPNGQQVAMTQNNYSDARGFGGYDNWSVEVLRLNGSRSIAMPEGAMEAVGQSVETLPRAQHIAWSPAGTLVAVQLPPKWDGSASTQKPLGIDEVPGEIWLWQPGQLPQQRLAQNVDFASPLAWLP